MQVFPVAGASLIPRLASPRRLRPYGSTGINGSSIYQRWRDGEGFEGHPPRVNASKPPGEWQTFDVVFRAPRFDDRGQKTAPARFVKVVHNGTVVHEDVALSGPTRASAFDNEVPRGPLMLQGDHGPVAYRNLRIRGLTPSAD